MFIFNFWVIYIQIQKVIQSKIFKSFVKENKMMLHLIHYYRNLFFIIKKNQVKNLQ